MLKTLQPLLDQDPSLSQPGVFHLRLFFLPINLFVRFEAIDHYLLLTIDSNFLYHIHPVPLLILTPHPISWQCTHQLIMHLPQHHKVMFSSACHANCHHANKMQAHTQTTCVTSCTVSLGNFMHHDIKPDNFPDGHLQVG